MTQWVVEKELAEVGKSPVEVIRVSVKRFGTSRFADLRVYYMNDDGEYVPTRKGVTLPLNVEVTEGLLDAVDRLNREAERACVQAAPC